MNSNRFDIVIRTLSVSDTRRGVIKALAAVGAGVGLIQLAPDVNVDARRRRRKKRNKKRKKSLSARCSKSKQCKGDLLCRTSNSQNSCFPSSEKRCCIEEGQPCEDSCDCCGIDVICNGGFCQNA